MGHRLSVIATRTGDDGTTGLGDGSRVGKDAPRIAALGDVDELNSTIGLILTEPLPPAVSTDLQAVQHDLFALGGGLSIPGYTLLEAARVAWLDERLRHYNADLPPLREFILPGGNRGAALTHVARTICRRAERHVVTLTRDADGLDTPRHYLNRLSDLLFVLARVVNRAAGAPETLWRTPPAPP